jgi:hypothetical protein
MISMFHVALHFIGQHHLTKITYRCIIPLADITAYEFLRSKIVQHFDIRTDAKYNV